MGTTLAGRGLAPPFLRVTSDRPLYRGPDNAVEPRLRRRADRASIEAEDAELARLFERVATRRRARGGRADIGWAPDTVGDAGRVEDAKTTRSHTELSNAAGVVLEARDVSTHVRILRVARRPTLTFRPGQHVRLGVGGKGNPYTIASAPDDAYVELCIERVPAGRLTPQLFGLRQGDRVELGTRAKGDFSLVRAARVHLMVATVTGISPFRSMLRDAVQRDDWPGQVILLHGASFGDELPYRDELTQLSARLGERFRYLATVSRPADPRNRRWSGATGRVDVLAQHEGARLAREASGVQVYACGHPGMVAAVRRTLGALGLPVASEAFD